VLLSRSADERVEGTTGGEATGLGAVETIGFGVVKGIEEDRGIGELTGLGCTVEA
jgi:hypothetical protein